MAALAKAAANDPKFSAFARSLGSLAAVDSWVRAHYSYRDEWEEIVRDPRFMLGDMGRMEGGRVVGLEGDCDDIATFYAAMVTALGYRARLHAIRYNPSNPNFEHVFTQVYDGGDWRILDGTLPPETPMNWIESMIEDV